MEKICVPKFYFPFKYAVFDLDDTLWDLNEYKLFPNTCHIFHELRKHNIPIYIASFNLVAKDICEQLGISRYITDYRYNRHQSKLEMIRDMIKHPQEYEIVFFDDQLSNIKDVCTKSLIQACHVPSITDQHLQWKHIPHSIIYRDNTIIQNNLTTCYITGYTKHRISRYKLDHNLQIINIADSVSDMTTPDMTTPDMITSDQHSNQYLNQQQKLSKKIRNKNQNIWNIPEQDVKKLHPTEYKRKSVDDDYMYEKRRYNKHYDSWLNNIYMKSKSLELRRPKIEYKHILPPINDNGFSPSNTNRKNRENREIPIQKTIEPFSVNSIMSDSELMTADTDLLASDQSVKMIHVETETPYKEPKVSTFILDGLDEIYQEINSPSYPMSLFD